jgi:uncharacterized protein YfiM (DUF2279 family)
MKWLIVLIILLIIGNTVSADNFLGKDKIAHFSSSMFLVCWTSGFSNDIGQMNSDQSRFAGVGITLALGIGKEGSDRFIKKEQWGWCDLVWDVMGIGCGLIILNNGLI